MSRGKHRACFTKYLQTLQEKKWCYVKYKKKIYRHKILHMGWQQCCWHICKNLWWTDAYHWHNVSHSFHEFSILRGKTFVESALWHTWAKSPTSVTYLFVIILLNKHISLLCFRTSTWAQTAQLGLAVDKLSYMILWDIVLFVRFLYNYHKNLWGCWRLKICLTCDLWNRVFKCIWHSSSFVDG